MNADMDYPGRPNSELFADLHIYVVPPDLWREHLNSAVNQIINDTVSAGFLRVHPEMTVHSLREELEIQLGMENIPQDYYFLKSVGRCLTRIKPKQEFRIKVKHFLPPLAYAPEIYLLEATPEVRALLPASGTSSERSDSHGSWRNQMGTGRSDKSDFNPHKPIPPIRNGNYTSATQTGYPGKENLSQPYKPGENLSQQHKHGNPSQNIPGEHQSHHAPVRAPDPWSSTDAIHHPQPLRDSNYEPRPENYHKAPGEPPLPPLSASPPASPEAPVPHSNHTHSQKVPPDEQGNGGSREYLPPLSATPPTSPGPPRRDGHQPHSIDDHREEQERRRRRWESQYKVPSDRVVVCETPSDIERITVPHNPLSMALIPYEGNQNQNKIEKLVPILSWQKDTEQRIAQMEKMAINQTLQGPEQRISNMENLQGAKQRNSYMEKQNINQTLRMQQEEEERRAWEEEQRRRQEQEEEEERHHQEVERRRREEEIERRRREDERRQRAQEEENQRRQWEEEQQRQMEERQRWEEERHRWEEEQRQREEQRLQLEEEERRRQEEEQSRQRRLEEEQHLAQERALPPVNEPHAEDADERADLLAELEAAREERKHLERQREELVRKAKSLQTKSQSHRNQARDAWKKKYFEEKKKTPPLEDQANKLRQELETLHRRIMSQLEGSKEKTHRLDDKPSPQNPGLVKTSNLKIQATKLQHEIEELQRKVENVKMKLTAEMKLRNQAETELRALRAELTQKKINVTLSRSQQLQALNTPREMYSPRTPAPVASQR